MSVNNFRSNRVWKSEYKPAALLHVSGGDTLFFLQGQFTQDLRSSASQAAAYGLWLNQKGKVLADSVVLRESDESAWIVSLWSSARGLRERLDAYIIADDVTVTDLTAGWHGIVIGGPDAEVWLTAEAGGVPAEGEFLRAGGGVIFRGRRNGGVVFEWLLPSGSMVAEGLVLLSADEMERARIAAGIPRVPQDIGPGDLPNEGGLEAIAVSYTKGCYLGQEVMARLKAMGTVRRRLVRVRAAGRDVPAVPSALLQGEKRVGELRSAVADGTGGFMGLAMVTKLGLDPTVPLAPEPGGEGFIELIDMP